MRELAVLSLGLVCMAGGGLAFWVHREAALQAEARAAAAQRAAQEAAAGGETSPDPGRPATPAGAAASAALPLSSTPIVVPAPPGREVGTPCPGCGTTCVREVAACSQVDGQRVRALVEVCAGCGQER